METNPAPTHPRTEVRRARSLIELGVVVALSVGFYWVAATWNLFQRLDKSVHLHNHLEAGELFVTLPFALLLLALFSWRRYLEAQAETVAAAVVERDLARTTEEFRSLFDYHPHAVFSVDPHRHYRRLNPAAEALAGVTGGEMLAKRFPALKTENEDRVIEAFEQALKLEPQRLETALAGTDGKSHDVVVTMIPIVVDANPIGVYVVAEDVTDANRIRQDLAQALVDAEQASEAKTLLVANVSHELRTPLAGVLAAAEVLADSDLDDLQQQMVAIIDRNGEALRRLVDDLLDLTRLEVGQVNLEEVVFDLCDVLNQAVTHASAMANKKGLDMRVDLETPLPGKVVGDPLRLGQVLTNVLNNAVKFTEHGEVGVGLRWQHRGDETVEMLLRVWDTGIGIAPDDHERLFDHFVQADPSSTRKYGGVGLGLAISRQLVELMGGALTVDSEPGAGSTFTVRLALRLVGNPDALQTASH